MSVQEKIKVGDIVQLKTGGPEMTVDTIPNSGEAKCVWFNKDNEKEFGVFDFRSLIVIDSN